jgi:capsular polysaccharide biosynthesis protein
MDFLRFLQILGRWWWLVLGLPLAALIVGVWLTSNPPYESTLRATVLIPGDTEIPGNAERPELMVLDDAPVLVESEAFAAMVAKTLPDVGGPNLSVAAVQSALSGERYSRVLTIHAKRDNASEAKAIADAAAKMLPDAVNTYLVAAGGDPATVRLIDPPSSPSPANVNRWPILAVETLAVFFVAVVLALTADALGIRRVPRRAVTVSDETGGSTGGDSIISGNDDCF